MPEEVALVGIVPRQGLWSLIERERWYHIPVESAPGNALSVKRIQLFPREPEHKRAGAALRWNATGKDTMFCPKRWPGTGNETTG